MKKYVSLFLTAVLLIAALSSFTVPAFADGMSPGTSISAENGSESEGSEKQPSGKDSNSTKDSKENKGNKDSKKNNDSKKGEKPKEDGSGVCASALSEGNLLIVVVGVCALAVGLAAGFFLGRKKKKPAPKKDV